MKHLKTLILCGLFALTAILFGLLTLTACNLNQRPATYGMDGGAVIPPPRPLATPCPPTPPPQIYTPTAPLYEEDAETKEDETVENTTIPPNDLQLHIALATETAHFTAIHELDYSTVHPHIDMPSSINLAIWANVPLRDFAVISIFNDIVESNLLWFVQERFGEIAVLQSGEGFLVNGYVGQGTMPFSGITFVDENGDTRYFTMQENAADMGGEPWILREFEPSGGWADWQNN